MKFEEIHNKDLTTVTVRVQGTDAATATNYGVFFIAGRAYEVREIRQVHGTSGNDAGAVTLNIERLQGTEALDAGDEILKSSISLKGTANTVITRKGYADLQNRKLSIGDRLALKDSGTLTNVADVCVTILLEPINKGHYN